MTAEPILMNDGTSRPELIPVPRAVKMKVGCKVTIAGILLFTGALVGLYVLSARADYRVIAVLLKRGVETEATVTAISEHQRGGRYLVTYSYNPVGYEDKHHAALQGERYASPEVRLGLYVGSTIQIIYDPLRPNRQRWLNRAELKNQGPLASQSEVAPIAAGIFFFGPTAALLLYLVYLRNKKLLKWGHFSSARIISEKEYSMNGPTADVTYEFADLTGVSQTGVARMLPGKDDRRQAFIEYRQRRLLNPTVIFLPENSRRSALYPLSLAELSD